jgi:hypothetical protein
MEERDREEARSLGNFQISFCEFAGRDACTFGDVYVL